MTNSTNEEMFARLGTDGPNSYENGPEPTILEARGIVYLHVGTGNTYKVTGYGWDAERDRWLLEYMRFSVYKQNMTNVIDTTRYFHLPEDFFRPGRFVQVK